MEVDSWLRLAAPPAVENRRRDPNALRKNLHAGKLFWRRNSLPPSAQGIQIPCLPLPPSVSVAAQTVDLKNFSPFFGRRRGARLSRRQGNAGNRRESGDRKRPSQIEEAMPQFE